MEIGPNYKEGWNPDPLGRHTERWIVRSETHKLVRDSRGESRYPIADDPLTVPAVPVTGLSTRLIQRAA